MYKMTINNYLHGELVDDFNEFFAPVSTDLVSELVARYNAQRIKIESFHELYNSDSLSGVISYFCRRNDDRMPRFDLEGAICALNSDYWSEAFALTDVYKVMPQKRRDAWNDQLSAWRHNGYKRGENPERDLPDFEDEIVRSTLTGLLGMRSTFFAERVDGIFRSLSKEHVTNCPQGFSKRMIITYVIDRWGSIDWKMAGVINDLRSVIAKFMGRPELDHGASQSVIKHASSMPGQWVSVDGGSLRIRVYNGVGTAHLEVHPEMAWRLNAILASLYPAAIPESARRKPVKAKKIKDFDLFDKLLSPSVVSALDGMSEARRKTNDFRRPMQNMPRTLAFSHGLDKAVVRQAEAVLYSMGAVKMNDAAWPYYQFDYDFKPVLDGIICNARIPDDVAHQFYPTPESVAVDAVAFALEGHEAGMHWLEPSAGNGGLADHFPQDAAIQCYDVSDVRCKVLEAKGYASVVCADFIKVADQHKGDGYHRIVMNPPYSEGRWQAHTQAAGKLVRKGGRLVAILPASARGKDLLDGFNCTWSRVYANEFAGTSISVAILIADRN